MQTNPDKTPPSCIHAGLVGTGTFAQEHAKALRELGHGIGLKAAFDIDPEKLKAFIGQNPGVAASNSLEEMLNSPDVDLIVVATPPSTHEAIVISALDAGKRVVCSKPLSNSMRGALKIVEAAERHPGRLAVDYQIRYDAAFERVKSLCDEHRIGQIRSARIQRHSYIPHANAGTSGWWGSWKTAGGGVLITQLIHEIDLVTLIMGKPLSVKAMLDTRYTRIESDDTVDATLFYDGGRVAILSASVNSGCLSGEFKIHGDKGEAAMCPQPMKTSPHARFYAEVAECMRAGRPLPIPAAEALTSLEVCMAIYASGLSGLEVKLPLTPDCPVFSGISKEQYDRRPNAVPPSNRTGA